MGHQIHSCFDGAMEDWCLLSCFSRVRLFATPWTVAHQASLSVGILQARVLEWVAMIFPTQVIKPKSPAAPASKADSLLLSHRGRQCELTLISVGRV